jgi:hypothetical protein
MNLAMECIQGHFRAALAGTAESDEPAAKFQWHADANGLFRLCRTKASGG